MVDFAFQGTALYYTANSDYKDGPNNVHDHWGNKVTGSSEAILFKSRRHGRLFSMA